MRARPGPSLATPAPAGGVPRARPRAVLLDWDDTLVQNWACIHEAMSRTLEAMGRAPWSPEETRRRARRSLRESFPELFGARWETARDVFYAHFTANHLRGLQALPGAQQLLERLSGYGIFLAVISNKTGPYLRRETEHLGWSRFFGAVVGAADAGEDKPAVAPVDLALAGTGVDRGPEVWLAGDGAVDVECARRAGCVAVLLRERPPAVGEFGPAAPPVHVRNCAALLALVGSLPAPGRRPDPGPSGEFG